MTELPVIHEARVNVDDVSRFLEFLDTEKIFTFSILDKDSESVVPGYGVFHGTMEDALERIAGLDGATLHVTLNRTNLKGRRTSDIVSCRVLCLDLDTETTSEEIRYIVETCGAAMVVQSSPGKFHLYWKIDPTLTLEDWSFFQLGLAAKCGGDKQLYQLSKTIRVPGVARMTKKGEPFMPSIRYHCEDCDTLNRSQIIFYIQGIEAAAFEAEEEMKRERKRVRREYAKLREQGGEGKIESGELGRNLTIYEIVKEACGVFEIGRGALELEEALDIGREVNKGFAVGLDEREVIKASESAWKRGCEVREGREEKYLRAQETTSALLEPEAALPVSEGLIVAAAAGPQNGYAGFEYDYAHGALSDSRFSDMAMTQRVVQRFWEELARVAGKVYAFNLSTRVWGRQDAFEHTELFSFLEACARDVLRDPEFLRAKCMTPQGDVSLKKQAAEVERVLCLRGYRNLISAVLNNPQMRVFDEDIFDSREELLFTASGVLDMKTGAVRDANAADFLLNRTGVRWDPAASCPQWMKFLREVYAENEEPEVMVDFLQELFGYSLSGSISEQKLFCHSGDGSNGKSMILWALGILAGGYAAFIDPDELVQQKGKFGKNFERFGWKIEGKRLGIVDDIEVKTIWSETFVKGVTANQIRCRGEHEKSRQRVNHAKVHLGLNVMPAPQAENYGLLRRLCLIPYRVRFEPDADKRSALEAQIVAELPGILRWAVTGYARRMARGGKLLYPAETVAEVEAYRKENFSMETICEEMFQMPRNDEEGTWEFLSALVDDVNSQLRARGRVETEVSPESLVRALKRMGKVASQRLWDAKRKNSFTAYRLVLKYGREQTASPLL